MRHVHLLVVSKLLLPQELIPLPIKQEYYLVASLPVFCELADIYITVFHADAFHQQEHQYLAFMQEIGN